MPPALQAKQAAGQLAGEEFVYPEPGNPGMGTAYAIVNGRDVPVFESPVHHAAALPPVRRLDNGFISFRIDNPDPLYWNDRPWYRIGSNEYVSAEHLRIVRPSLFHGAVVPPYLDKTLAWMIFDSKASREPGAPPPTDPLVLPGQALAVIEEIREVNGRKWCRVGENWWIEYERLGLVRPSPRPAGIGPGERWVEVNLFEQTLAAYTGDRMVYTTLISSGDRDFPTVIGLFRLWAKARQGKMSGGEKGKDYYYLADVPWQMYFHASYALHATYWHNYFGLPSSHGCVNLAPADAKWLYDWTSPSTGENNWVSPTEKNPGTWVWIHE